jgi:hypothetical protein
MSRPQEHLTQSVAEPDVTTNTASTTANTTQSHASSERYQLSEEIARGGMGEVYRAHDTVLNREVAVKVLQGKYTPTSGTARRFADEARITGQLQHPAIPPVHDLGTLPDGRPFLAMKLIKGQTLDELLKANIQIGQPTRPELTGDDHPRSGESAAAPVVAIGIGRIEIAGIIPEADTQKIAGELSNAAIMGFDAIHEFDEIVPDTSRLLREVEQSIDPAKYQVEGLATRLDPIPPGEDRRGVWGFAKDKRRNLCRRPCNREGFKVKVTRKWG